MKQLLVFFLLAAAVYVSVVPRVDSPETPFNEADAPVNLAPAPPSIRVTLPVVDTVVVLPALLLYCPACFATGLIPEPSAASHQRHGHSLQSLLCTLLI